MKYLTKLACCSLALIASTAYCDAPYISGEIGGTEVTLSQEFNDFSSTTDKVTVNSRIAAGYLWDLNPCVKAGVEVGFQHFNKVKDSWNETIFSPELDLQYHQNQYSALAVIDYSPFSHRFNVFAKGGVAHAKETTKWENPILTVKMTEDDTFAKGVIGAGYNVTENVNLNLAYERNFDSETPKDNFLLGVRYSFN